MTNINDAAPIWLVGCGNMGGAMLRGWLSAGLDPARVTVVDPKLEEAPEGVRLAAELPEDASPHTLVLAIKPQQLRDAAPALRAVVGPDTLLLSILAGTEIESLVHATGAQAVIRAMPNMPAAIARGVTVLHGQGVPAAGRAVAEQLVTALGAVEWIDNEALFDVVTALSGSGPAYVFRFIDSMAKAGAALGLEPGLAARLAVKTVAGSALLAESGAFSPAALAEQVASPGGTTRAGLDVLDRDSAIQLLLNRTLGAAAQRSAELAAAAREPAG